MTARPPSQSLDPAEALARRLAILDAITTALSEVSDLPSLLDRALTTVMEITGVDGGGIFLFEERTGELRLTTHRGVSRELVDSYAADPGPTIRALASNPQAAVIVRDVRTQRLTRQALVEENMRSYAGIPLHVHDQMLGVLMVISRTISDFNQADVDLLVSIGKQIGLAIERARLYDRERRRAQQLETISEVGRRLGAILAERELLPQIVNYVREHLGYESANLLLLDESGDELVLQAAGGLGNESLIGGRVPADPQRSMSGWVVANNEPLLANDVSREPRHFGGTSNEQAELDVPIHLGGRTIGVLDVQSAHIGAFHEEDISVLQILAGQIAVAIENARLYDAAQRSLRRMRAFQEVVTAMTASLDLRTTLERALDVAMDVFGADRAALWLLDQTTRRTYCAASRNLSASYLEAVIDHFTGGDWPAVLDTERSVYVEDAQAAHLEPELIDAVRREGFRTMLYLPLLEGDRPLGIFVLYHDQVRRFSEEEIGLARTFADQTNIAIQHAYLFEGERRARDQAATILEATRTVTSSLNVDDVLTQAAGCIAAALAQRACGVWLLNDEGTMLLPVYRAATRPNPGLDRTFRALPSIPLDAAPRIKRLLADAQAFVVQRPEDLSEPEQVVRRILPFDAYVAIPLAARNRVLGIATVPVLERHHHVDEADIEVAMAIARSTALALENARLYEESRRLAVSEERNRLARELHDSVTHSLFSMNLIAQALPRIINRDADQAKERIERLAELGRGALAEMRALIFHLRPAALEEQGLAAALAKHVAAFESREGISVELTVDGERRLPLTVEEAIFRVAQEALNNVVKHAAARRVTVALATTDTYAELVVQDDGKGFDPAALPAERTSLGLTSMGERATLVGGVCTVDSTPGKGTTVWLRVPVGRSQE